MDSDPLRHHNKNDHSTFGNDKFGILAERFAKFFGTPKFIIGQTIIVALWIIANAYLIPQILNGHAFDIYPFVLLNLVFSTQAAYAAPLILLAQTRQADRDKATSEADAKHREDLADNQIQLLKENTELTRQVHLNTQQIEELHTHITALCEHFNIDVGNYDPPKV